MPGVNKTGSVVAVTSLHLSAEFDICDRDAELTADESTDTADTGDDTRLSAGKWTVDDSRCGLAVT